MVAFNFKKEFVEKIKSGEKISTIRRSQRCNIGDNMQLYTGQRTKNCEKIADAICVGIAKIEIDINEDIALWDWQGSVDDSPLNIIKSEGFESQDDMVNFFKDHYGLPFTGYLHVWRITNEA